VALGQVSSFGSFVDKRRGRIHTATEPQTEKTNMLSISDMRTRLAAINGTYYTAERLNAMTDNDMRYALRDAASI
jgi:hypothetical protein